MSPSSHIHSCNLSILLLSKATGKYYDPLRYQAANIELL